MRWILLAGVLGFIGCSESPLNETMDSVVSAPKNTAEPVEEPAMPQANDTQIVDEKPRTDGDPVSVQLILPKTGFRAGTTFEVSVVLHVAPGYEIHDLHAPPPMIPTTLDLELPPGFKTLGEWSAPEPVRSQMPDGHPVYIGEAAFTRVIRIDEGAEPGDYKLACSIRYQACNIRQCLAPKACKLSVTVPVHP